ncbi:MAG: hypothetical protein V1738_05255 [Patescibacteria group bacterium]
MKTKNSPDEQTPFQCQLSLLKATLENAEGCLAKRQFRDATSELTSVWSFRYAGAKRLAQSELDEMLLLELTERHAKLVQELNLSGGLLRRLLRRFT